MKDFNTHKPKFSPYLEKLYNSDKPLIIYKVKDGYNLYTDFSKKIILTNKNINNFFNLFSRKKLRKETPNTSPLSLLIASDKTIKKSRDVTIGEIIVWIATIKNR